VRAVVAATVAALALAAAGCGGSGGSGCTFRRPSAQDAQAIRAAIRRYDRTQTPIKRERISDLRVAVSDRNTASAAVEIVFPPAQGRQALVLRERGIWHVFAEGSNLLANIENQTRAMTEVLSDEGRLC
jgi:hypothetical protein